MGTTTDPEIDDGIAAPSRPPWLRLWRRWRGLDCRCGGEWGVWERKEVRVTSLMTADQIKRIRLAGFRPTSNLIQSDVAYQERRCVRCGKVEQEELEW